MHPIEQLQLKDFCPYVVKGYNFPINCSYVKLT